ncbi:nucleotide excision repair endonuclease [bacterium]|nr:nucleotide excision repair endonuclease [bacterium]
MQKSLIDKIFDFLFERDQPADSLDLTGFLGLKCQAEAVADQIVMGLVRDDDRFYFDINHGWSITDMARQKARLGHARASHSSPDSKKAPRVVVAFTFNAARSNSLSSLHQIAAQRITSHKRLDRFGPFMVSWDRNELAAALTEDVPVRPSGDMVREFLQFCADSEVIIWRSTAGIQTLDHLAFYEGLGSFNPKVLPLAMIAEAFYPHTRTRQLEEFLEDCGWHGGYAPETIDYQLENMLDLALDFQQKIELEQHQDLAVWLQMQQEQQAYFDFSKAGFDRIFLQALPASPGVYLILDPDGHVLYTGKSLNLHQRVNSYFSGSEPIDEKITQIRGQVHTIEIIRTGSELSAEILEASLILKYRPPLNTKIEFKTTGSGPTDNCFLVLPAVEASSREIHLLNRQGHYSTVCISSPRGLKKKVSEMLLFFEAGVCPDENRQYDLDDTMRTYAACIMQRWWTRYRDVVPLYEYKHFSPDDLYSILAAALDETFHASQIYL